MFTSNTVVPYATFLEIRARRQRIVAALARPSVDGMATGGAPGGTALTIDGESITVIQQPTTTAVCRGVPVEL